MATEGILGIAQIPVRAVLDKLDGDLAEARKKTEGGIGAIVSNVQKVGKLAIAGIGTAVAAVSGAIVGLGKLAIDAAPVEGLRDAFEGLATSSGKSMDEVLGALKKGSYGMVSQRDLMASYNSAAQLVGLTFANQLPEAMQYLSKVSAATGQDMGFMVDSLVKGVGRVSPMILDNLGIQVSLAEATERAAQMYGVQAEELEKSQIQAGMMSVVLEKLQANTAAMPDVSESAAAGLARMKATMQDLKDRAGLALLPVLNSVLGILGSFLPYLEPVIAAFESRVVPVIEMVVGRFQGFITALQGGTPFLDALRESLNGLLPANVIDTIIKGLQGIIDFVNQVIAVVGPWIAENVEIKDVLIALGIAIAAVVLPALYSIVTAAAPVIAVGLALIAAVVLIRKAWESDFLGIRTFIEETLATIRTWWAEHGEQVLAKAQEIWQGVVAVVQWFVGVFTDIFNAWKAAFSGDWYAFGENMRAAWDKVWEMIKAIGNQAWQAIKDFFTKTDWGAVGKAIIEGVAKGITAAVGWLKDAARRAAQAALDAAKGFLGIHSPSSAFELIGQQSIEGWARGLANAVSLEGAVQVAAGESLSGGNGRTVQFYGPVTIPGVRDGVGLLEQLAAMG